MMKKTLFSIIVSVTSLLAPTVSVIDDVFERKADGSGTLNLLTDFPLKKKTSSSLLFSSRQELKRTNNENVRMDFIGYW